MFLSIFETDFNGKRNKIPNGFFVREYGTLVLEFLKEEYLTNRKCEFVSVKSGFGIDDAEFQFDIKTYFSHSNILYVEFIGTAK